ncbi:hypothetical protein HID58_005144 [Brassica napus]|uniref:Uncharacterized protein n=1 Tax=Brassica napus TaxID=3708 RepID=A0ABQ8E8E4_BRANA|nr:hypothetical protein HID58_005144 [Brassica napus]
MVKNGQNNWLICNVFNLIYTSLNFIFFTFSCVMTTLTLVRSTHSKKSMRLKVTVLDFEQCQSQTFSWFHDCYATEKILTLENDKAGKDKIINYLQNLADMVVSKFPELLGVDDTIMLRFRKKKKEQDRAEMHKSLQIILSNLTRGLGNWTDTILTLVPFASVELMASKRLMKVPYHSTVIMKNI